MKNKGFSLVEVVIVVAVVAILAGISAPAYVEFLKRQRIQLEENALQEISRAMETFSLQYGRLPSDRAVDNTMCNTDNNTWNECLALVTNLSPEQILTDTWGNERSYIAYEDTTAVLLGSTVSLNYASLFSLGPDREAADGTGIATEDQDGVKIFAGRTAGGWWSNANQLSNKLRRFQELSPAEDDMMIKYTDRPARMAAYELTLTRLKAVSEALESYARMKYNEASINKEENAEKKVFYPPSDVAVIGDPYNDFVNSSSYGKEVRADMTQALFGNQRRVSNDQGNENLRRTEMINLMRLLGLPDSYCCNAMKRVEIGGEWVEPALFYYSNPRATTNGVACNNYRGKATESSPLYLPARVTTEAYPCP